MSNLIPSQLASETATFLRIAQSSKAPKRGNSASEGPFFHHDDSEVIRHLGSGGNLARVLRDGLVAIDVDSYQLREIVTERLPDSFEIETGGDGIGFHRYYRSPEFQGNQVEFKDDGTEIGGLRSGNSYCLVPPSEHDQTGNVYSVSNDTEIAYLPADTIEKFISEVKDKTSQHSGGGGGCVGGSPIPEIPPEYPENPATWQTTRKWLESNGLLDRLNYTSSSDWSGVEFSVAKCLAEGGFNEPAIFEVLNRLHHSAKWHNKGGDYRNRTVRKAIAAACNDEFISFETGDMEVDTSESHKTEEAGHIRPLQGGETEMPEFTDKLSVPILEASDEGDSFKNLVLVEGQDGSETFEYVALKKGRVEEAQTTDGDTVIVQNVTDSVSLGSPEYIEELAEGLEALADKIED